MLKEDKKAGFYTYRVALLFRRHIFAATSSEELRVRPETLDRWRQSQRRHPVAVADNGERTWWWFEDRFYWEDEGYSAEDVLALVRDRQRRKDRQLQRAKDLLAVEEVVGQPRGPIQREVRRAVFTRDGGKCVECGSTFDLQYDHIIPVALGGASTVENLQILCADCNRRKSDSL